VGQFPNTAAPAIAGRQTGRLYNCVAPTESLLMPVLLILTSVGCSGITLRFD
jgi:hypothetical protein